MMVQLSVRLKIQLVGGALLALFATSCSDDSTTTPCKPTTCQAASKNCGTMPDGCGKTITCGTCTAPEACGSGGTANVCGQGSTCPKTTCQAAGKNCGAISDNCADVLDCGSCTAPESCGGAGVANVCGEATKADAAPTKKDASLGVCDPSCMAQSGAECCTGCGCKATVRCTPTCDAPARWDCEMTCCWDSTKKGCQ